MGAGHLHVFGKVWGLPPFLPGLGGFPQEIAGLIKGLWKPLVSLNKAENSTPYYWGGSFGGGS